MAEQILEHSAIRMYEQDQAKYSIVVNRRRAIPEVRDGLKPVQRRILYAAFRDRLLSPSKKDKSQSLAGTVMKYYHPHSDCYGSIVTMVQWFQNKIPLMYGKGNWGSVSGAGAAAGRYTETALSNAGYDIMIDELQQSPNVVDWLDTYKRNGDKEPEYLPAKLPMLIINGAFGIGVGMSFNLPSHNPIEVIEATRQLLHNPKADVVLVPDLCQPCEIIDTDWADISHSGRGSFKARGIITQETDKKGNIFLHIISLPDSVTTTSVYEKILGFIEKKQLPMIADIWNTLSGIDMNKRNSDKTQGKPDIIIKLKPGADPNYVKQFIYQNTDVEKNISINFEAVDVNGIDIKRFSYKEYLQAFIDERMNIKFRLYCNKLQQVMTRHHQVDAYVKVLESGEIDTIINMIRKSKGTDDGPIIEHMIKKCKLTDVQAKFIIGVNLSRLSAGYLAKYRAERKDLEAQIKQYSAMVEDDGTNIKKEIDQELYELEKKYGTPRICKVISSKADNDIPAGIFKIVITEKNFIRKIPDVDKINIVRKDNPKFIIRIDNRENLLLFDNKGKVFNLPVSKIPLTDKQSMGTDIRIIVKNLTSDIAAIYPEEIFKKISKSGNTHYLIVLTKNNFIKRLQIEDFLNVNPSGLIYSKITPDDEVVGVLLASHTLEAIVSSGKKALRFKVNDIPIYKRNAIGCKAMDTNDPITGISIIYPETDKIIVLTKNGKFNKFDVAMMQLHSRARKGSNVIKLANGDSIFGIYGANDSDKIRVVTTEGIEEIPIANIKLRSSIAAGDKMLTKKGIILKADIVR